MRFHVTSRSPDLIFGTVGVWRNRTRVQVSDPSRTLIDILDDPRIGGGVRHCADVLHEYLISQYRDDELMIEHGDRVGNRTAFKRLGYLLEARERGTGIDVDELVKACLDRRSAGVTSLDPTSQTRGRIMRRWGMRINANLNEGDES